MAKLIQAVAWLFGLGLVTRRIGQLDDVVQALAYGFDLTKSKVPSVLSNMQAVMIRFFNQFGSAVKLSAIGTLMSALGSGGRMRVSVVYRSGAACVVNGVLSKRGGARPEGRGWQ
jgi:hypothetical protein